MERRAADRLFGFALGVALGLALASLWPAGEAPPPTEREERIARDLRIAKEVERDHARRRAAERERAARMRSERRRSPTAPGRSPEPRTVEDPEDDVAYRTLRPTTRAEMVGRWRDDETATIWMRLFEDGRYSYGGFPGEFVEGSRSPPRVVVRDGRRVVLPGGGPVVPGWAEPHEGRWRFEDGVLRLEPEEALREAEITFTWDALEAAIRVRFLGVAPSHTPYAILRRVEVEE